MRIVHFADAHLGYRAYHRVTDKGINQREQDVQNAFGAVMKAAVDLQPDLVLMAGDLFHSVRPSNLVLQRAFKSLMGFRRGCAAPMVMIAGNHESPRSTETGCILKLFENIPDIHVRDGGFEALKLTRPNVTVFCLPHRGLAEMNSIHIAPTADSETNLLMLHGTLDGIGKDMYDTLTISRSQVLSNAWDYIALGHYHIHTELAPNAFYSGSTEYTSHNPWEELGAGRRKGFIEYDTATRQKTFHAIKTRDLRSLDPIHGEGLSADEIMERVNQAVEGVKGGLNEKVVRLRVFDAPRSVQADLDHARLRELRASALHFDLAITPPRPKGFQTAVEGSVRRTLEQEWSDFVAERELPGGVERDRLTALGLEYLALASAERVPTDAATDTA